MNSPFPQTGQNWWRCQLDEYECRKQTIESTFTESTSSACDTSEVLKGLRVNRQ